jgi:hypothetical protein
MEKGKKLVLLYTSFLSSKNGQWWRKIRANAPLKTYKGLLSCEAA